MFNFTPIKVAIGVLMFAYLIEFLQLFQILKTLNLQNNKILATVFGNTFQISDLLFYTLGVVTILIIEYKLWHFLNGK
jgi:predicted ferric reductase